MQLIALNLSKKDCTYRGFIFENKNMNFKIDYKIVFFALFFCITKQIKYYIIIMLFASIHEFAHLITGVLMGFKPKKIGIMPVGLILSFKENINNYNKKVLKGNMQCIKKIIVLFAGPLINLLIVFIFIKININFKLIRKEEIIYSNMLIAIFNLLPIYPLDGGKIIKQILHIFIGLKKSIKYILKISNISLFFLDLILLIEILMSKNLAFIFIIIYLTTIVLIENKNLKMKYKIYVILEKNIAINKKK